jgi:hypothetical protein
VIHQGTQERVSFHVHTEVSHSDPCQESIEYLKHREGHTEYEYLGGEGTCVRLDQYGATDRLSNIVKTSTPFD